MRKSKTDRNKAVTAPPLKPDKAQPTKRSLTVDVDYYQKIIDDPSVSEERKRELIAIIGNIVTTFIDIGFGVHTVQLAKQEKLTAKVRKNDE